jgi:glycerol-1-phosphate dehydrogenase [NAD(P)+]
MERLFAMNGAPCPCGREHRFSAEVLSGPGVVELLPQQVRKFGAKKVFVLSDLNTFEAAGRRVCRLLSDNGLTVQSYTLPEKEPEPDEARVGSAVMHMDSDCDLVVGVGSGVINDIGKILAAIGKLPYIIVGTAPSMDGYASATSSMIRDGFKISLPGKGADVIIGDTDILRQAPLRLLQAGLGDMIAKYVSICEWRIASLITGEYYCEEVAELIRQALQQCVSQAEGLLRREEAAVAAVFEGLVIGGVAMNYAGCSHPASGAEHYISHVLDMRGVEYGTKVDLHGIQCAIGTLEILRLYEKLLDITPDREKALDAVRKFDYAVWAEQLRSFLGRGAENMIALEEKEGKYSLDAHGKRLDWILDHWEELKQIIREELPSSEKVESLLTLIGAPKRLEDIGADGTLLPMIFRATKDIRDKYVLSRLAWDLGLLEELIAM